jgi:DNA-binding response OmpR family regulator
MFQVGRTPDGDTYSPDLCLCVHEVCWATGIIVMNSNARQTILFVDDQLHWRNSVSASLSAAGYDVLAAADGSEAMRKAVHPALGLIIVDEDLGGESGVMLTQFLRRNHPDVPTMLYTETHHDVDKTLDLRDRGVDQWLPKGKMEDLVANVVCCVR